MRWSGCGLDTRDMLSAAQGHQKGRSRCVDTGSGDVFGPWSPDLFSCRQWYGFPVSLACARTRLNPPRPPRTLWTSRLFAAPQSWIRNITMRMDKLTSRFQQALSDAQSLAVGRDNNMLAPVHVLTALLDRSGGSTQPLLAQAGVNVGALRTRLGHALEALPQVRGQEGN